MSLAKLSYEVKQALESTKMPHTCQDQYGTPLRKHDQVVMAFYIRSKRGVGLRLGTITEILGQECIVVRSETSRIIRCRPDSVVWHKQGLKWNLNIVTGRTKS